jgi:hypothetical protein
MYYAASRPLTPVPPALSRSKMTPQASSSQGGRPMRNVRFYSDSVQTLALPLAKLFHAHRRDASSASFRSVGWSRWHVRSGS